MYQIIYTFFFKVFLFIVFIIFYLPVGILRDGRDNEWQHGSLEAEGVPLQDCMSLRIMKLNPNKQKDQMAAQNMEIYPGLSTMQLVCFPKYI